MRSQVTGTLARQMFTDGARVRKGEVLYVIDQRPFQAQLAQAEEYVRRVRLARARSRRRSVQRHPKVSIDTIV